jgi:hypothetical protein
MDFGDSSSCTIHSQSESSFVGLARAECTVVSETMFKSGSTVTIFMAKGTYVTFETYSANDLRLRFCPPGKSGFASSTCFVELVVCGEFMVNVSRDLYIMRRDFFTYGFPVVQMSSVFYPHGKGDWLTFHTGKGFSDEVCSEATANLKIGVPTDLQLAWFTLTTSYIVERSRGDIRTTPGDEWYIYSDALRVFMMSFSDSIGFGLDIDASTYFKYMDDFIARRVLDVVNAIPLFDRSEVTSTCRKMFLEYCEQEASTVNVTVDSPPFQFDPEVIVLSGCVSETNKLILTDIVNSDVRKPCIVVNAIGCRPRDVNNRITQAREAMEKHSKGASLYISFVDGEARTVSDKSEFLIAMRGLLYRDQGGEDVKVRLTTNKKSTFLPAVAHHLVDVRHPLTAFLDDGSGAVVGGMSAQSGESILRDDLVPAEASVTVASHAAVAEGIFASSDVKDQVEIGDLASSAAGVEGLVTSRAHERAGSDAGLSTASVASSAPNVSFSEKKRKRPNKRPDDKFFDSFYYLDGDFDLVVSRDEKKDPEYTPLDVTRARTKQRKGAVVRDVGRTFSVLLNSRRFSMAFSSSGSTLVTELLYDSNGARPPLTVRKEIASWTEHQIVYKAGMLGSDAKRVAIFLKAVHSLVCRMHSFWVSKTPANWLATYTSKAHVETLDFSE